METDRQIDLSRSVHDLCKQYPEVIGIMQELGFADIVNPGMLMTAGRFMTIPKGAKLKKISLDTIKSTFARHGYTIIEEANHE